MVYKFERYDEFAQKVLDGKKLPKFLLVPNDGYQLSSFCLIRKEGVELLDFMCIQAFFTLLIYNGGKFRSLTEIKRVVDFVEKSELRQGLGSFLCMLMDMSKNIQNETKNEGKKVEIDTILLYLKEKLLKSRCVLEPEAVKIFVQLFPKSLKAIKGLLVENDNYSCCFEQGVLSYSKEEKEFAIYLMENGYVNDLDLVLDWFVDANMKTEDLMSFRISVLRVIIEAFECGYKFSSIAYNKLCKLFWNWDEKVILEPKTIFMLLLLCRENVCSDDKDEKYQVTLGILKDVVNFVTRHKKVAKEFSLIITDSFSGFPVKEFEPMDELCVQLADFGINDFRLLFAFEVFLRSVFNQDDENERLRCEEILKIAKTNYCNLNKKD